ncbi:RNA-directed DNA methylation 4 isoform X1 [Ricinus communis]|uniref:RNA-directed DNA methylation 4 isoform X1 n=1 Tax=Ricinus communis TaxID=3988 RepID=UPI000D6987D7|nr:RNA-directed DNA methylation 4 isoform X1 [Ricinus communis]|eukprot:XP_025013281.1 RNA-directed DNA methylation 4 isoform X1 [Ricinus communis]
MASMGESSSTPKCTTIEKPLVVRVKRKSSQFRLDALWLEINERPSKRPLFDFQKLSISDDSAHKKVEESKTKKVFVHHITTVSSSDVITDILQSFVPSSAEAIPKSEERKQTFKKDNKQEQLLSKARQSQEISAQNARFEQIWRSRRGNKEASDDRALHDMCHFYDVVRVDVGGRSTVMQEQEVMSLEDQKILSSYLPLLREFIPSAAADIECDINNCMSKPDDYVYDYYTVRDDMGMGDEDSLSPFPLWRMKISMMGQMMNQNMKVKIRMLSIIHGMIILMKHLKRKTKKRLKHLLMNQKNMMTLALDLQNLRNVCMVCLKMQFHHMKMDFMTMMTTTLFTMKMMMTLSMMMKMLVKIGGDILSFLQDLHCPHLLSFCS